MMVITRFDQFFCQQFPDVCRIMAASNLVVHPLVARISLHGSRGPAQTARPDSDFDLCLHVDVDPTRPKSEVEGFLRMVLEVTLSNWRGPAEIDLAAVYALRPGGLDCFEWPVYDAERCPAAASDQFGLYKIQQGFDGFVDGDEISIAKMYPCTIIWRRPAS